MWADFKRGELPVPDLRNLEIYHEIGLGLDLENMDLLSRDAYLSIYAEKLADWDSNCPIQPDGRLWRNAEPAERPQPNQLAVA